MEIKPLTGKGQAEFYTDHPNAFGPIIDHKYAENECRPHFKKE